MAPGTQLERGTAFFLRSWGIIERQRVLDLYAHFAMKQLSSKRWLAAMTQGSLVTGRARASPRGLLSLLASRKDYTCLSVLALFSSCSRKMPFKKETVIC